MAITRKKKRKTVVEVFTDLGVNFVDETGDQLIADCPFTGKSRKLYVNKLDGRWILHSNEGGSGNVYTFLERFWNESRANTTAEDWDQLARLRGLPREALEAEDAGLAFSEPLGAWLFAVRNHKGTVVTFRLWYPPGARGKDARLLGLTYLHSSLWGMEQLPDAPPKAAVWLAEGEWDGVALRWLLRKGWKSDRPKPVVVASPGAGCFKEEWAASAGRRKWVTWFDHDEAGRKGRARTAKLLSGRASEVETRDWDKLAAGVEGFDCRDFVRLWKEKPKTGLKRLLERSKVVDPRLPEELEEKHREHTHTQVSEKLEEEDLTKLGAISWEQLLDEFRVHLEMTPTLERALWVCSAVVSSVPLGGPNPLWVFLVGPPGAGKTELLSSFGGLDDVEYVSTLSSKSLVSGFNVQGGDPSLLSRMSGRSLVLKDFTEVRDMHPTEQREVYSILRGAYDGRVDRMYGNGVQRSYHGLWFSVLAGVTDLIHMDRQTAAGERFLKFCLGRPHATTEEAIAMKAMGSMFKGNDRSKKLRIAVARFLWKPMAKLKAHAEAGELASVMPTASRAVLARILGYARLVALLRSDVLRDLRGEVQLSRPAMENTTRLAQQLLKLATMLAWTRGRSEVGEEEMEIVDAVAWDSATGWHADLLRALREVAPEGRNTAELARQLKVPKTTLFRRLEDAEIIGLVRKRETANQPIGPGRPGHVWVLSGQVNKLVLNNDRMEAEARAGGSKMAELELISSKPKRRVEHTGDDVRRRAIRRLRTMERTK